MTCVGSCMYSLLQLSQSYHQLLLLLLHSSVTLLLSFTLILGMLANSNSSNTGSISQTDRSKGLKPGSRGWVCTSSRQSKCLCHHLLVSAPLQH